MSDDEEPKPGTLGESRSRTAAMPRLVASIHARQSAEVFDKGRTACRGDPPARCLEELIRLRVDRCYRENGPSRLVRTLAPTAHQNLAASLFVLRTASGNDLWCIGGAGQRRLLGAKRKTCALSEVYSFWLRADIIRTEEIGFYLLNSGFPNSEGARSSRKRSNWVLPPTPCPDALLSGTIASTANCQATAT